MPTLTDLDHVVFLIAEGVRLDALAALPAPVTTCRGYRLTPPGEDRADRLWPAYAVALREAGYTVHLRASMPDTLGDVTVVEARPATVEAVVAGIDDLPAGTLLAIALAADGGTDGGVSGGAGGLGAPGVLLLRTPWAAEGRSEDYDEVCDHTSVMQLCEAWTAARGRVARAGLTDARRAACDDLVGALGLSGPDDPADEESGADDVDDQ